MVGQESMGTSLFAHDRPLTIAIGASLVLHFLLASFMPSLVWFSSAGQTIEIITFIRVPQITIQTPRPRIERARATAPKHALVPQVARLKRPAPAPHARRVLSKPKTQETEAPVVSSQTTVASGSIGNVATATPVAPSTPAQREVASAPSRRHQAGGYLPLGAEQPDPILDPTVQKALAALSVHVTLLITVGDDGRTKTVEFQPPLDAQTESKIQSMLADASWDPAVCGGGVPCEGHAVIKL
jgi:hypothetical protein